jgi:hypothetical protein
MRSTLPRVKGVRRLAWTIRCTALVAALSSCRDEHEPPLSVRALPLQPVAAASAAPADAACELVEREARKLGASLPKRLDEDTAATRVNASGCNLTLEYQLLTLTAAEVDPSGMHAMRGRVVGQLCTDPAARATLERGGTFTNVYNDQVGARIGHFTVKVRDCATARRSALEESRL